MSLGFLLPDARSIYKIYLHFYIPVLRVYLNVNVKINYINIINIRVNFSQVNYIIIIPIKNQEVLSLDRCLASNISKEKIVSRNRLEHVQSTNFWPIKTIQWRTDLLFSFLTNGAGIIVSTHAKKLLWVISHLTLKKINLKLTIIQNKKQNCITSKENIR